MKACYLILSALLLLAACNQKQKSTQEEPVTDSLEKVGDSLTGVSDTLSPAAYSKTVLLLLKKKRYGDLKNHIHPTKGIRFSPYGYINVETDVHIKADELPALTGKKGKTLWGSYDGSGEDILLSFSEYAARFIYDADYLNAEKFSINQSLSGGNTLNNLREVYPDAQYTESYFSGFEKKYEGMDWKALRLVFEKHQERYYLVGIVHDQWTI